MIVITGASDGVGLQLTKLYNNSGKKVVSVSRRESEFADRSIIADFTDDSQVVEAARQLLGQDEPIEALINAAGVWTEEPIDEITQHEIDRVMRTNANAVMLLTSTLLPRLKKDGADILNVISTAGTEQVALTSAVYTASKWALRGYTKALQNELKPTGCRVIGFCPGGIDTDFFEKYNSRREGQESWMQPADIAHLIKQLLDLPKNMQVSEIIINRK